jgi:NAD dependent epimerase/dehydratase family enzyme
VIGRDRGAGGGARARLGFLARLGLGGRIGSGTQGMSWIHETDMNRLFERALTDPTMRGPYIASSPNPVSQRVFMRELRRGVGMPIGLPAFSWMVRWGARWFLRTDPELALYGRFVVSKRLREEQFEFQFAQLSDALKNVLGRRASLAAKDAGGIPVLFDHESVTPFVAELRKKRKTGSQ